MKMNNSNSKANSINSRSKSPILETDRGAINSNTLSIMYEAFKKRKASQEEI